jgi:hypothetical protein
MPRTSKSVCAARSLLTGVLAPLTLLPWKNLDLAQCITWHCHPATSPFTWSSLLTNSCSGKATRSTAYTQTLHRLLNSKTRHSPSTRLRPSSTQRRRVMASNTLSSGRATTNCTTSGSPGPRHYAMLTSLLRNSTSANSTLLELSMPCSSPQSTGNHTKTSQKLCTWAMNGLLASTLATWLAGMLSPRKGIMC